MSECGWRETFPILTEDVYSRVESICGHHNFYEFFHLNQDLFVYSLYVIYERGSFLFHVIGVFLHFTAALYGGLFVLWVLVCVGLEPLVPIFSFNKGLNLILTSDS